MRISKIPDFIQFILCLIVIFLTVLVIMYAPQNF